MNTTTISTSTPVSFSRKVLEKLGRDELIARYAMAKKDADKNRVLDVLKSAVKADNISRRKAFIASAAHGTIKDFALNQFVARESVVVDGNDNISITTSNQRVSLLSIDSERKKEKMSTIASDANYKDVLTAFTNNIIQYHGAELGDDDVPVTITRLHYGRNKWGKANEYHFADENGNPLFDRKHLYEQLDAMYAFILGVGVLHPRKANLAYVLDGSVSVVRSSNIDVKTARPKAILDLVMATIAERMTDSGYVIDTGAKAPKATKAEEMAEEAISKKADPVVEPMTGAASPDADIIVNATTISKTEAAANKARKDSVKDAESLELSARVLAVLKAAGVNDARGLTAMTEKELKAVKGIGKAAMVEISGFMTARGLTFKAA